MPHFPCLPLPCSGLSVSLAETLEDEAVADDMAVAEAEAEAEVELNETT